MQKAEGIEEDLKEILCYRARIALKKGDKERTYELLRALVASNPDPCKACLPEKDDFEELWQEEEFKELSKEADFAPPLKKK